MNRVLAGTVAFLALGCGSRISAENETTWIDQQKIRAAYHYGRGDADESVRHLKAVGINAVILKCSVERAIPWLEACKKHGLRAFPAFNFNVNAEKKGIRQAVLESGVTEAYACPLADGFWDGVFTPALLERAELAAREDLELSGLWIDFELYSTRTGQRYYTQACYCDTCFAAFCGHKEVPIPDLPPAKRKAWLEANGMFAGYHPFLQAQIRKRAELLRKAVHALAPDFLLGFYPTPKNWSLLGVAQGFSTADVPVVLWATDTYGGGGAERVPDDWRTVYTEAGINARYVAGMLLRCYSSRNLAANLFHASRKCDGYWLFTTYTLSLPVKGQKGDYYLASGSPSEYWDAISCGNQEIDRALAVGRAYESKLVAGPEPVILRAFSTPMLRERLLGAAMPPQPNVDMLLPEVQLRGQNVLVVKTPTSGNVTISLALRPVNADRGPVRWQAVAPTGNLLAEGEGKEGEDALVHLQTDPGSLFLIVASARGACWRPARTNAAVALYAGHPLHIMGRPDGLWFRMPQGAEGGTVRAKGASGRERVRCVLYNPDGRAVVDGQTTAEDVNATITIPPAESASGLWKIVIREADGGILEDFTVELPCPFDPLLFLSPLVSP